MLEVGEETAVAPAATFLDNFCSPPPPGDSKNFLQELDEAAAKLDSALKEVSFQEEQHEHSMSMSREVSQLWEDADDDDLSDEIYNLKFSEDTASTIAGLIINHAKRIPEIGEIFVIDNIMLTVSSRSKTRITKVQIQKT